MAPSDPPHRDVYQTTEGGAATETRWDERAVNAHADELGRGYLRQAREIEALKAERDKWKAERDSTFEHAQRWRAKAERHERMHAALIGACRALNKGLHRLRRGRDNAIKRAKVAEEGAQLDQYQAEIARLEGLISDVENLPPTLRQEVIAYGLGALCAEARAIKARKGA